MNNRNGRGIILCDMNQAWWKECSAPSWKQGSIEGLVIFKFYRMNIFPLIILDHSFSLYIYILIHHILFNTFLG